MIKVLVADDHPLVRGALIDLLTGTDDIVVVADCADGSEVVAAAARTHPDVVLMDLVMPQVDGLQAARDLLAAQPSIRVVLLTGSFSATAVRAASAIGAVGFLLKGDDPAELPQQIRDVAGGGTAWSRPAAESLAATG